MPARTVRVAQAEGTRGREVSRRLAWMPVRSGAWPLMALASCMAPLAPSVRLTMMRGLAAMRPPAVKMEERKTAFWRRLAMTTLRSWTWLWVRVARAVAWSRARRAGAAMRMRSSGRLTKAGPSLQTRTVQRPTPRMPTVREARRGRGEKSRETWAPAGIVRVKDRKSARAAKRDGRWMGMGESLGEIFLFGREDSRGGGGGKGGIRGEIFPLGRGEKGGGGGGEGGRRGGG